MSDRERLIKAAEARYVGSSLPWLWERERRAIAHAVDAVLAALPAEPGQEGLEPVLLCKLCREGAGGECHTPGCGLWMNRAPDVPVQGAEFSQAAMSDIFQAQRKMLAELQGLRDVNERVRRALYWQAKRWGASDEGASDYVEAIATGFGAAALSASPPEGEKS